MAELVDAHDSKSCEISSWGFKSLFRHQNHIDNEYIITKDPNIKQYKEKYLNLFLSTTFRIYLNDKKPITTVIIHEIKRSKILLISPIFLASKIVDPNITGIDNKNENLKNYLL